MTNGVTALPPAGLQCRAHGDTQEQGAQLSGSACSNLRHCEVAIPSFTVGTDGGSCNMQAVSDAHHEDEVLRVLVTR